MLANCIIENTGDGHMDYWAQNEMNGYKALLLYISTSETLKATGRNTLAEMYNICTQNTPAGLATLFNAPSTADAYIRAEVNHDMASPEWGIANTD